jgi:hypothetical protein
MSCRNFTISPVATSLFCRKYDNMRNTLQSLILRAFFLLLLMNGVIACNNSESTPAVKKERPLSDPGQLIFDRLTGTWQNEDGKSFERWTKNADGTYRSDGFSIKANDTSWNEQASIYRNNSNWIFENKVKNQNDGKAIQFTSTLLNENSVQFSNPAHDFPTDINYTLADATTLRAFIVGPNGKGGKDTIPFNFTKLK